MPPEDTAVATVETAAPEIKVESAPKRTPAKLPKMAEVVARQTAKPAPEKKPEVETKEPEKKPPVEAEAKAEPEQKPEVETKPEESAETRRAKLVKEAQGEPRKETKVADVDADLKPLPTDTESVKKRIKGALDKYHTERTAREKSEQEIASIRKELEEAKAKAAAVPADLDKIQAENLRLRRLHEIKTDPEFAAKYDQRIKDADTQVATALKSIKLPEWLDKEIVAAGGLAEFARSSKSYTIKNKEGADEEVVASDLYERVLDAMKPIDADGVRMAIAEAQRTRTERDRAEAEETGKAKEHFDKQRQQSEEQAKAEKARRTQIAEVSKKFVAAGAEKLDWLKDQPLDEAADAETKKRVVAENGVRRQLREAFDETMANPIIQEALYVAKTQQEMVEIGEIVTTSIQSIALARDLSAKDRRIKELEDELKEVRGATRTTPRSGNGAAETVTTAKSNKTPPARQPNEGNLAYTIRLRNAGFDPVAVMARQTV